MSAEFARLLFQPVAHAVTRSHACSPSARRKRLNRLKLNLNTIVCFTLQTTNNSQMRLIRRSGCRAPASVFSSIRTRSSIVRIIYTRDCYIITIFLAVCCNRLCVSRSSSFRVIRQYCASRANARLAHPTYWGSRKHTSVCTNLATILLDT